MCLDGRHVKCRRNGCACGQCAWKNEQTTPVVAVPKVVKPPKEKAQRSDAGLKRGTYKERRSKYEGAVCAIDGCVSPAKVNWMCTRCDNRERERRRDRALGRKPLVVIPEESMAIARAMRASGSTYKEIGERIGFCGESVRRRLLKEGSVTSRTYKTEREAA